MNARYATETEPIIDRKIAGIHKLKTLNLSRSWASIPDWFETEQKVVNILKYEIAKRIVDMSMKPIIRNLESELYSLECSQTFFRHSASWDLDL